MDAGVPRSGESRCVPRMATPADPFGVTRRTRDKFAYCEANIGDVSHPHVEHVLPKSELAELMVSWDDFTLGCPLCDTNQGPHYSEDAPLLQPYVDDPIEHLVFRGPAIFAHPGSDKGRRTVNRLRLSRAGLLTSRTIAGTRQPALTRKHGH